MSATPNGWEKISFRQILNRTLGGGTPSRSVGAYFQGAIPWFTVKDLKSQYPNKAEEYITKEAIENSSTNLVPAKTLIVATRISLGKAIRPRVDCAINQDLKALFFVDGINPDFILHWFSANERLIKERGSGTTVQGIRLEALNSLPLLLPPSEEQTRIVEKLEELLPQLDAGITELQAAQKKLTQYRQSLLKAAVEGQLTADWRTKNVPAEDGAQLLERILSERRTRWEAKQLAKFNSQGKKPPKGWQDKYPEPAKPDTTNLPELPEGWVWATIEEVGNVQLGRQRSPNKLKGLSPTKYIRAANITENGVDLSDVLHMDFNEEERETFYLQQGDILLTEASGSPEHVGRPAIWKGPERMYCFQNTVLRFSPKGITSTFSYFSFMSMQKLGVFRKLSAGVGINHLSAGKFSRLPIAIPGIQEQETIVSLLDQELEYCNKLEREIDVSLSKIALQRQNILRAAFAGELVPQDPNDEPASELLARISAERAAKQVSKRAPAEGNKPTAVEPSGTKRRKRKEAS